MNEALLPTQQVFVGLVSKALFTGANSIEFDASFVLAIFSNAKMAHWSLPLARDSHEELAN